MCRPPKKGPSDNSEILDKHKNIKAEKLEPVDHMDAVKIEQDGHINKDFHKEAFIGEHEEIDDDPPPIAENKLIEIFKK